MRELPATWVYAGVFAGYFSFLNDLQLARKNMARKVDNNWNSEKVTRNTVQKHFIKNTK